MEHNSKCRSSYPLMKASPTILKSAPVRLTLQMVDTAGCVLLWRLPCPLSFKGCLRRRDFCGLCLHWRLQRFRGHAYCTSCNHHSREYGTQTPIHVSASLSYRIWYLYHSQAILIGFGVSFLYIPSLVILSQWFKKTRSLVKNNTMQSSHL